MSAPPSQPVPGHGEASVSGVASSPAAKSWQARIAEATDAIAQRFVESVSYDWRLYPHDIAGSIAHATMLAACGLISEADRDAIVSGLKQIHAEIDRDGPTWPGFRTELEDIHMCIEAALIERIGEPGRRLHTARSRNDQVALDLLLWIRASTQALRDQVLDVCRALVRLAERSVDVVLPSYTHLQRAQPVSAAAEALAWATMLDRDAMRLRQVADACTRVCPLGSGAIAGTSLPTDPSMTARMLGFDIPPVSAIDHTACRDEACGFTYVLAMVAQHLSRWAEQWIVYMTTEFSFLRIADRYTTSSSMMPQKKNPDMLELIRGRCANVYGDHVAMLTLLKGLPVGYNRDLQEDKRILFRAFDTVSECLAMAAAIIQSAEFLPKNIEPTLERGFLDATSLAEYLVTLGVPFRTAHHVVGTLVARCEREGKTALAQLPLQAFNETLADVTSVRVDEKVFGCLGARQVVSRYQSAGAAGGEPLKRAIARWQKRLGTLQAG